MRIRGNVIARSRRFPMAIETSYEICTGPGISSRVESAGAIVQGWSQFSPGPAHTMTAPSVTPSQVRCALLLREEIALLDVRHEAGFATGHPLFAANMA